MKFDQQKFSEFLRIYRRTFKEDWINELYSIIDEMIDNKELSKLEGILEIEHVENADKLKQVIFDLVLDVASSRKSTYIQYKFDTTKKNLRSLKPKVYLKTNAIKSLVEQILLPQKRINSYINIISKKLNEIEAENADLNSYKTELNRKVELLQTALKRERDKRKKQQKFKNCPEENVLYKLANECRKKNGTINYSKLSKELGCSNVTAKSWCDSKGIV
jgi:hypothetical protein